MENYKALKIMKHDLDNLDKDIIASFKTRGSFWKGLFLKNRRAELWIDYMELKYTHEGLI